MQGFSGTNLQKNQLISWDFHGNFRGSLRWDTLATLNDNQCNLIAHKFNNALLLKKNPLTVSDGLGSGRKCNISLIFSKTTWAVRKKETKLMIKLSELSVHAIQNFETLQ